MENSPSVCEEKTYSAIYHKYSKLLHNFVYYKCGDSDQAADFIQEAFITLWNNCNTVFLKNKVLP